MKPPWSILAVLGLCLNAAAQPAIFDFQTPVRARVEVAEKRGQITMAVSQQGLRSLPAAKAQSVDVHFSARFARKALLSYLGGSSNTTLEVSGMIMKDKPVRDRSGLRVTYTVPRSQCRVVQTTAPADATGVREATEP